ncbi:MAG: ATP-binding protein [Candidatus Thorarchaeota archaeon]
MEKKSKIKQLTVISGKGGTGKSSIIASLAYILKEKVILADADVDAADLYLIFTPKDSSSHEYYGLKKAEIDLNVCTKCNICRDSCRFDAIDPDFFVQPFKCEGCSLCYHVCPESAVMMKDHVSGHYFISDTRIGKMVHAKLKPGEESSGLLVAEVRKKANEVAKELNKDLVLIDGSPGIGCPVISSITGSDLALVVTEPTISGKHDLERVLKLLEQFRIGSYVIVNKTDINLEITQEIEEICKEKTPVIANIPHNHIFTTAMIDQKTVIEMESNTKEEKEIQETLFKIAKTIEEKLQIKN